MKKDKWKYYKMGKDIKIYYDGQFKMQLPRDAEITFNILKEALSKNEPKTLSNPTHENNDNEPQTFAQVSVREPLNEEELNKKIKEAQNKIMGDILG